MQLAFSDSQMQAAIYAALAFRHQQRVKANENQIDVMIGDLALSKSTDRKFSTDAKVNKLIKDMFVLVLRQGLTEEETMSVAYLVGAGYAIHKIEPNLRISGENLEQFRAAVINRSSLVFDKNILWPPTKQTISAKLGNGTWNTALGSLGFPTTGRSIDTYSHKYKKSDFAEAVSEFTIYCAEYECHPSMGNFDTWHRIYGGSLPNSDQLRKHYKNWSAVVRIVQSDLNIFDRDR